MQQLSFAGGGHAQTIQPIDDHLGKLRGDLRVFLDDVAGLLRIRPQVIELRLLGFVAGRVHERPLVRRDR